MLRYNISLNKEPDSRRVTVILATALFLIILFTSVGLLIQSRDRAEVVKNNEKLDQLSRRIDDATEKAGGYRKVIADNKSRYGKEVDYLNRMIDRSSTPFMSMFDYLEELLPATVSVREIKLAKGRVLKVTLESETMAPLIEVLEKLPEQKLVIAEPNSKRKESFYTATITVGGGNAKK